MRYVHIVIACTYDDVMYFDVVVVFVGLTDHTCLESHSNTSCAILILMTSFSHISQLKQCKADMQRTSLAKDSLDVKLTEVQSIKYVYIFPCVLQSFYEWMMMCYEVTYL